VTCRRTGCGNHQALGCEDTVGARVPVLLTALAHLLHCMNHHCPRKHQKGQDHHGASATQSSILRLRPVGTEDPISCILCLAHPAVKDQIVPPSSTTQTPPLHHLSWWELQCLRVLQSQSHVPAALIRGHARYRQVRLYQLASCEMQTKSQLRVWGGRRLVEVGQCGEK
jgi:hypothetical protein